MQLQQVKSLFLKSMIGCLVAAAGLAVVTVLIGQFNDVLGKALFTIVLVAVHCLVSFGFIVNNEKQETFDNLVIFTNATFILIVMSFITSILGTWGLIPGDLILRLYALYFVLIIAVLHGEVLARTRSKQSGINNLVFSNYAFMLAVVCLLVPVIFIAEQDILPDFYYRLLAACGIVDATLTLIIVIMHKLYLQKHPTIKPDPLYAAGAVTAAGQGQQNAAPARRGGLNGFVIVLLAFLVLQFAGGIIVAIIGSL